MQQHRNLSSCDFLFTYCQPHIAAYFFHTTDPDLHLWNPVSIQNSVLFPDTVVRNHPKILLSFRPQSPKHLCVQHGYRSTADRFRQSIAGIHNRRYAKRLLSPPEYDLTLNSVLRFSLVSPQKYSYCKSSHAQCKYHSRYILRSRRNSPQHSHQNPTEQKGSIQLFSEILQQRSPLPDLKCYNQHQQCSGQHTEQQLKQGRSLP